MRIWIAALAEKPIEGNSFAMKVLSTPEEIKRAADAVDWVDHGNSFDRDQSLDNLEVWRKKLEENSKKPPAATPNWLRRSTLLFV